MYYSWCMLMIHIFTDLTTHLALFQQNFKLLYVCAILYPFRNFWNLELDDFVSCCMLNLGYKTWKAFAQHCAKLSDSLSNVSFLWTSFMFSLIYLVTPFVNIFC